MKALYIIQCLVILLLCCHSGRANAADTIERYIVQPVGYSLDTGGDYVPFGRGNIARWSGTNIGWYLHVYPDGEVVDNANAYSMFDPPTFLQAKAAISAACSTWQAVEPATVTFTYIDREDEVTYNGFDEKNVVFWSNYPFGENASYWGKVALTTDSNNNIIDADIGFNTWDADSQELDKTYIGDCGRTIQRVSLIFKVSQRMSLAMLWASAIVGM